MIDCIFATCAAVPQLDPDDRIVLDELARRGYATATGVWNDPRVDWAGARACILRSTWDYHTRYRAFLAWIDRVAQVSAVRNQPDMVRWNADKSYLGALAGQGVPVVPTVAVRRGERRSLREIAGGCNWPSVVVKPSQGAAAHGVFLVREAAVQGTDAQARFERLVQTQDALVQPYLSSVATYGERALIFFEGRYSHAVVKKPFDTVLVVDGVESSAVEARSDEIAVAERAIEALPEAPLYARVDLLRGDDEAIYVGELELIEPGLYIGAHAAACASFADAIERVLRTSTPSAV